MIKLTQFRIPATEVLPLIRRKQARTNKRDLIHDFQVNVTSQRLILFKNKGTKCASCGISGIFFQLERHNTNEHYHLALYAINRHGHKILMTQDHIIPLSKNGRNTMKNLQPMCIKCNTKKGNQIL